MAGIRQTIEQVFADMLADDRIGLSTEEDELHLMSDAWTLVVAGDPVQSAMLAVDDEDGDPETILECAMDDDEIAALRDLDEALGGALGSALDASPDPLTQMLGRVLEG